MAVETDPRYHARTHYRGKAASAYDRLRRRSRKWQREIDAVRRLAAKFDNGSIVLDVPLGTGRFLPGYGGNITRVIGLDISPDMLAEAGGKGKDDRLMCLCADAERLPLAAGSVDYAVCIRLLNWLTPAAMRRVVTELRRTARHGLILGFRLRQPLRPLDFVRQGTMDILPTPGNVRRWWRRLPRLAAKVRGKLRREIGRWLPVREKPVAATRLPTAAPMVQTFYTRAEMDRLFAELGLEIVAEHPIDSLARYRRRWICPYAIYSIRVCTSSAAQD